MTGRSHRAGRPASCPINDRQASRSSCPQTWKVAVGILLVCALFLIGVVIGYCVSQASMGKRLNRSCPPSQQQNSGQQITSDNNRESFTDARRLRMRHWNLISLLQSADYTLPNDFT